MAYEKAGSVFKNRLGATPLDQEFLDRQQVFRLFRWGAFDFARFDPSIDLEQLAVHGFEFILCEVFGLSHHHFYRVGVLFDFGGDLSGGAEARTFRISDLQEETDLTDDHAEDHGDFFSFIHELMQQADGFVGIFLADRIGEFKD